MNWKHASYLSLAAAMALGASPRRSDVVSFHVKNGTALTRSFESRQEVSLDEVEMLLNGQPIPTGTNEGMTLIQVQELELLDEFVSIEGAQPRILRRSFQKILSSGEQTTKHPMDAGEQEDTIRAKSELEGKTVVFEWDESKATFNKRFDPEGPEEKLLAGLVEDVDFRGLLPATGQASVDDSWRVDVAAMSTLLLPGGNLSLAPVEGPGEGGKAESTGKPLEDPDEAFRDLQGEVEASYRGSREIDGVVCGVIALQVKVHSTRDLSDRIPPGLAGPMGDVQVDHNNVHLSLEGDGELTWDLAAGHARSFTMTAKIKNQMDVGMKIASGDKSMDVQRKMQMSGTYQLEVKVVRR